MSALQERWRAFVEFITNLDARTWRSVGVTMALFVIVGIILLAARLFGTEVDNAIRDWLNGAERAHLGLFATILIFTVTAYIGAPQIVLIAACVAVFGPEKGFWYAWAATIVSGAATFWTGWVGGVGMMKRLSGSTGGRFSRFMGRNGFAASFIIRLLPSAPFIVVNMAMGAARMGFLPFIGGLTLGVLPKTALVAFAGDGLLDVMKGNVGAATAAALVAVLLWIGLSFVAGRLTRKNIAEETPANPKDA